MCVLFPKEPLLADLSGIEEARAWGEDFARDLPDYLAKKIAWSEVDPGLLLCGLPGTGKTLFAKALAATCKLPLIVTSYAQWQRSKSGHMGDVLAAMHADFDLAKKHAPCILFIDEIEAVSSRTTLGHNQAWYAGIITALSEEFNELYEHEGVVVIAAANYPDRIDPALLRAGRLDRTIEIPLPNAEALKGILRFHLKGDLPNARLADLAVATIGMTGADIERLVRRARRRARKLNRALLRADLFSVLGENVEKVPPDLLDRIAIHEAGHAIAAIILGSSRNVNISLFHLGRGGASTFFEPEPQAVTRKIVEQRITVALAGRAAEEVMLGDVTAGAGGSATSDLAVAGDLAFGAVAQWGLSESGRLRPLPGEPVQIVAADPALAEEAYGMLETAYSKALSLIRRHKQQVRAIADALIKRRALAHGDIVSLLSRGAPGTRRKATTRKHTAKRA
jgi:ATP-dependent Zn protease